MSSLQKTLAALAGGALLLSAASAQAHFLWIEIDNSGSKIFYGEPQELLKEKSPGKLDNMKGTKALVQSSAKGKIETVDAVRGAQSFGIPGSKKAVSVAASEEAVEVKDLTKHYLGIAKSNYYARAGQLPVAGTSAATLALDLQQQGANVYAFLYRGQPLKGAKLEVIAPNTWTQEHKTDSDGKVEINTPWRGQYVLHVLHIDRTPGEFEGKKYDNLRNHFTYTFVKKSGANPGPALAPKDGN